MVWPWRRSARERAELARLRETEAYYRLLAERSPDVIMRYDLTGRVEFISEAVRRYGDDPAELVGRNIVDLLDPTEGARIRGFLADLAAGNVSAEGIQSMWRTPREEGGWVSWEGSASPIVEQGRVVGAMAVLRDVSDRVELEAAVQARQAELEAATAQVRESEARYRTLANHAGDLIVRYNTEGVIEFVSPAVETMLGYKPEQVIGRPMHEFSHPDDGQTRLAERLRLLKAGELPSSGRANEFQSRRADGAYVWLQGNPTVVHDDDGRPIAVVTVLRDITERRALEDELLRQRQEAERAVIAKAEFLATMSHEIRTPLTAVVGFASLLRSVAGLPERALTYAERIGRGGDMLTAIVNNVLDFSKIEAGQVPLKPETFDPAELIRETVGLVSDGAASKGLRLAAEGLETLPPRVTTDAGQLRQVLANLLANAIKFTHQGEVVLEAAHDLALGRLDITVRDTGIGIPAGQADRLFQRFTQVESSNARRFGGVGLGLAISRGLVTLLGGEIGLESVEGEGSAFRFWIPAPASTMVSEAEAEAAAAAALPRLRILLVDDVRTNRELLQALLDPFDLDLTEASGGLDAVDAARRDGFDLILMDLQMPDMDGMAATRAIRESAPLNRETPVIAVSASVLPSDVEACHAAGMCDHVPKPINPGELLGKIALWGAPPPADLPRRYA